MNRLPMAAVAAAVSFAASTAQAASFDPAIFDGFAPGRTTMAEVIAKAGPPTAEQPGRGPDRVLFYEFTGVVIDGAAPRDVTVVIVIDKDKKVWRVRYYGRD